MRVVFEKIRESEGESFACHRAETAAFSCPYHMHPEIEILNIEAGQGHLVVGDHVGRFAPGDLLLLGSGLPHMLASDGAADDGPTRLRYLQFHPENFGHRFWLMREMRPLTALLGAARRGLRFDGAGRDGLLPLLDCIWTSRGAGRLFALLNLLAGLAELNPAEGMASLGYAAPANHRDSERLNRAISHINAHLSEPLTLEAIAGKAGLSPQAFSRFFRKLVGMPCIDYVISLRISLACRHLLESDRSVLEIAYLVGFNNLSNFNRQFKAAKGLTPSAFRRRASGKGPPSYAKSR